MQSDEAILRYSTAKGYVQACVMIFRSEHYQTHAIATILPLHMLAAFALELYFKAWLLKAGIASKIVREYGHGLNSLYFQAVTFGLPVIERLEETKGHFAGPHSDFTYRYMNPGDEMGNTNWPVAFKVLYELDFAVDTFIGASASHGLQPGH